MKKLIGCLATLFFVISCVPKLEKPPDLDIDVPQKWISTEATAEGELSRWWTRFNDPRLNQLIDIVLRENYDLKAAATRLDAAAALARIAGADLYPQVSGNSNVSRQKRNFVGFPFGGSAEEVQSFTSNLFGISLNMSWEIDLWGRIRAAKSAALADFQATEAEFHGYQLSFIGQTVKAWFAAIEIMEQLRLSEATVKNYKTTNEQVHRRYRLGLRPSLDVRLSESNVASAEANLLLWQNQLQQIKKQLDTLLGRYPSGQFELSEKLPTIEEDVPAGMPADIVRKRPDLVAAEKRLAASYARVIESQRALYPRISLTGSTGTSTDEFKNLLNGDYSVWNLVGNLLQPIFQGGRLRAGVDLARSRELESLALYATTVLNAYAEVEIALAAEKFLAEREEALRTATEQSLAARDLADDRYARGLTNLIEVLEAQRRAFLSESQLIGVQRARLDNRVDLYLALGGDFMEVARLQTSAKKGDSLQ
ncbi:MAG: efflux transporter outer membrane subunit [Candidatus Aminicenantes bacterium]|jgi:NodT family efflux transporter outer membrane factor (OMF) lipoprotein